MNPLDFFADLLLRWRSKESKPLLEQAERLKREVSAHSLQEAKRLTSELLADGRHVRAFRSPTSDEEEVLLEPLPTELKHLLSDYAAIELVYGDQRISRGDLGASTVQAGFIKVGRDMEFAEVAVRPGDEAIYVLAPGEDPALEAPTIYHWLVLLWRLTGDSE